MNRFLEFLEKNFMPVASKLGSQKHLQALRDGITLSMPMIIIGSFFLIIAFLPYFGDDPNRQYLITSEAIRAKLLIPQGATFGMMGLITAFGVAYRLAERYNIDAVTSGVISLCSFLIATPFTTAFTPDGSKHTYSVADVIPTAYMGSAGIFVAIVLGIFSTEVFRWVLKKNIVIKMPDGVPPAVSKSFVALIPGFFVVTATWLVRLLIDYLHEMGATSAASLHDVVGAVLTKPLSALTGNLAGQIVVVFLISLFWIMGLHGDNIIGTIMSPIWLKATGDNATAFAHHHTPTAIFTNEFYGSFVTIGGTGGTIALVMLFIFWSRSKQLKQLGKLAFPAGLFMINEPVIFGTPIVMNPLLFIPFFLAPIVNVIAAYIGMDTGLVAKTVAVVPWTTPPLVSGFLATGGHISGAIMQLVSIVLDLLIYLPFFKLWDKMKHKEETGASSDSKKQAV
ncbi:PTS cellobiose transporter subunit IIC [Actinomycetes bacterium NPDC127524]